MESKFPEVNILKANKSLELRITDAIKNYIKATGKLPKIHIASSKDGDKLGVFGVVVGFHGR